MFSLTWIKKGIPPEKQPAPLLFKPTTDRYVFGRSPSSDQEVQAEGISRVHCTLIKQSGEWTIVDGDGVTGSRYGIFYPNGERITTAKMYPGQSIYLLNSAENTIELRRNRSDLVTIPDDRDLTVNHELSTRVLVQSLADQTNEFALMMKADREHRDEQVTQFLELMNAVCDEVKRLKTDFSISTADDGHRDKKVTELRTLTRLLAVVVGGAGLWLLVKDQQTASNIFGIVIMIGGAVGFGRSGQK